MTLGTRLTFSERPLFPPCRPWRSSPTGSPTAAADSVRARWHVPLTAWAPRTRAPLQSLGLDQLQAGRSATCALGAHRGLTKGVTRTPSATPQAKRTPARAHAAASACGGEAVRQLPKIEAKLSGRPALIPGLREPPNWDVQRIRSVSRFNLVHRVRLVPCALNSLSLELGTNSFTFITSASLGETSLSFWAVNFFLICIFF